MHASHSWPTRVRPWLSLVVVVAACSGDPNPNGPSGGNAGNGGDAGSGGGGGNGGTGGTGGGTPQSCDAPPPFNEPVERLYVAPNGDDAADGSENAPLASVEKAASRFPTGGTIIVRGGTYGQQQFDAKGTPDHPLVIRAADGEIPIFDGAAVASNWSAVIQLWSAENVVLKGLEIRNCNADNCAGISSAPVTNLTVRDCHIHHVQESGARFTGKTIRFEGNHIHDVALLNENGSFSSGWPTCMGTTPNRDTPQTPHADDVIIRNNRVENCWGEGIGIWFGSNVIVEGNIVDNAYNVGIYMDNAFNVTISRNFVRMTRGLNGQGSGILFGTEPYVSWGLVPASSHDITVTNNIVVAGGGIGWWRSDDATDANTYQRVSILHNTVIATSGGALGFDLVNAGAPVPDKCSATNNVFVEVDNSSVENASSWSLAGNAWLNKDKPAIAGASDVSINANVGTITDAAQVQPLSKVVGAGEANVGVKIDYACKARDAAAPTRGAFEP